MYIKKPRRIPSLVIQKSEAYFSLHHTTKIYLGDPINIVKILSDYGVDEIAIFVKDLASLDVCMKLPYYCTRPISISGIPTDFKIIDNILIAGYDRLGFSVKDNHKFDELLFRYGKSTLILNLNEIENLKDISLFQKYFSEIVYHDKSLSGTRLGLNEQNVDYLMNLSCECEISIEGGYNFKKNKNTPISVYYSNEFIFHNNNFESVNICPPH